MGKDLLVYLLIIFATAFTVIFLPLYVIMKIRKKSATATKPQNIECGNVSVFFDRVQNVVIIPYAKDKYGVGRALKSLEIINAPYTAPRLGNALRTAMNSCISAPKCDNSELMRILGSTGWKEFSKDKRSISVNLKENIGIVFNTTTRMPDGAYAFNNSGNELVKEPSASDRELGETLLSLLQKCR